MAKIISYSAWKSGCGRSVWHYLVCTATNIFLVISMIWFSYTDKLYIKMMGYPWEINWIHIWNFKKTMKMSWTLFWFLLPAQAKANWAEWLSSFCWHSPSIPICPPMVSSTGYAATRIPKWQHVIITWAPS